MQNMKFKDIRQFCSEIDRISESQDIDTASIDMKDCRVDLVKAPENSGYMPGQIVTRLMHIPTGIAIYSESRQFMLRYPQQALSLLQSRIDAQKTK
jgi:protein subunit release factor A